MNAQQQQQHQQNGAPSNQRPECPGAKVMIEAANYAIAKDKPIMLDYWMDSLTGNAFIGIIKSESNTAVLVKSGGEEYTSENKTCRGVEGANSKEYIFETANSIYIVSSRIRKREFNPA